MNEYKYYSNEYKSSKIIIYSVIELFLLILAVTTKFTFYFLLTAFPLLALIIYLIILKILNKPTLIINKDGIIDKASLNSVGEVNWSDIDKIEYNNGLNSKYICIFLKNDDDILRKKNIIIRFLISTNIKKFGTPFLIPEISLNEKIEIVFNVLKSYLEKV